MKIPGLHEMTIWRNRNNEWHVSVTVTQRSQVIYLSTRRSPRLPRPSRALRRRSPRDSGSVPLGRSPSCSGKQRTRLGTRNFIGRVRQGLHSKDFYWEIHLDTFQEDQLEAQLLDGLSNAESALMPVDWKDLRTEALAKLAARKQAL